MIEAADRCADQFVDGVLARPQFGALVVVVASVPELQDPDPDVLVFPIEDPSVGGRLGLELRSRFHLSDSQPGQRGQEFLWRTRDGGGGEHDGRVEVRDCAVSPAVSVEAPVKAQADRHDGLPSAVRLPRQQMVTLLSSMPSRWAMWVKLGQGQGCRHHDSAVLLLPDGVRNHGELVDEPRHARRQRGPITVCCTLSHSPGHQGQRLSGRT
ncbi:hypothetical protein [Streptomyces sp. NPDC006415]|uniref:hypothetical protein n=1 Tax=Streptomyces sp. NPDC006415 TaxID=3155351 RepID=UPI0033BC57C2